MKHLIVTVCLLISFSLQAQTVKVKSSYQDTGAKKLSFQTSNIKGTLSATNAELTVKLKNTSKKSIVINAANCSLIDDTGRGSTLCGAELTLASGKSVTVSLENCSARNYNEGLFQLKKSYSSKSQFTEEAFFLKDKGFVLTLSGEKIAFFTDL